MLMWLMNLDFAGGSAAVAERSRYRRRGHRGWLLPFIKLLFGG